MIFFVSFAKIEKITVKKTSVFFNHQKKSLFYFVVSLRTDNQIFELLVFLKTHHCRMQTKTAKQSN